MAADQLRLAYDILREKISLLRDLPNCAIESLSDECRVPLLKWLDDVAHNRLRPQVDDFLRDLRSFLASSSPRAKSEAADWPRRAEELSRSLSQLLSRELHALRDRLARLTSTSSPSLSASASGPLSAFGAFSNDSRESTLQKRRSLTAAGSLRERLERICTSIEQTRASVLEACEQPAAKASDLRHLQETVSRAARVLQVELSAELQQFEQDFELFRKQTLSASPHDTAAVEDILSLYNSLNEVKNERRELTLRLKSLYTLLVVSIAIHASADVVC